MRTVLFENLANYFGPMTSEQALDEAVRCEQEAKEYDFRDPAKRLFKRDSEAALKYAELLEGEERNASS